MIDKKVIVTAEEFGINKETNQAVLEGYNNGFLTNASLCATGDYFENAVCDILPDCPNLSISAALNISGGKPLTQCSMLLNRKGKFNNTFLSALTNSKNTEFLNQIEIEFGAQIEKIMSRTQCQCLNTINNIHLIPKIFELLCKLAVKYGIKYIRTNYEEIYFPTDATNYIKPRYIINLTKLVMNNCFTQHNKIILNNYNLATNDYTLGTGYYKMMDDEIILEGLKEIENSSLTEIVLHPQKRRNFIKNYHINDFKLIQNKDLEEEIKRIGFEITSYKNI